MVETMILGFDPGRDKCGLAVMGREPKLYYHQVVPAEKAITTMVGLRQQFQISLIVMGDQTTAKEWQQKIIQELPSISIVMVDERYTSLEARDRYWQMYPPTGLSRLIPQGMRQPPRPVDDIVAILLIEKYLSNS
jgi:RNase H-fold protein (predicted Holliday junction resolvase)